MKTNPVLRRWQQLLLQKIDPSVLHADQTWIHHKRLLALRTIWATDCRLPTKKWEQHLIAESLPLLRLIWKGCRKFTNPMWAPDTAIGNYLWVYQLFTVQELLWLRPEFIQGFEYARILCRKLDREDDQGRDACPFHDVQRKMSWDTGYIFGVELHYHPKKFRAWRKWLKKLPSPIFP